MTYRKHKGSDTWHWCTNCTNWPTTSYDTVTTSGNARPAGGELDNQCLGKERAGECDKA